MVLAIPAIALLLAFPSACVVLDDYGYGDSYGRYPSAPLPGGYYGGQPYHGRPPYYGSGYGHRPVGAYCPETARRQAELQREAAEVRARAREKGASNSRAREISRQRLQLANEEKKWEEKKREHKKKGRL